MLLNKSILRIGAGAVVFLGVLGAILSWSLGGVALGIAVALGGGLSLLAVAELVDLQEAASTQPVGRGMSASTSSPGPMIDPYPSPRVAAEPPPRAAEPRPSMPPAPPPPPRPEVPKPKSPTPTGIAMPPPPPPPVPAPPPAPPVVAAPPPKPFTPTAPPPPPPPVHAPPPVQAAPQPQAGMGLMGLGSTQKYNPVDLPFSTEESQAKSTSPALPPPAATSPFGTATDSGLNFGTGLMGKGATQRVNPDEAASFFQPVPTQPTQTQSTEPLVFPSDDFGTGLMGRGTTQRVSAEEASRFGLPLPPSAPPTAPESPQAGMGLMGLGSTQKYNPADNPFVAPPPAPPPPSSNTPNIQDGRYSTFQGLSLGSPGPSAPPSPPIDSTQRYAEFPGFSAPPLQATTPLVAPPPAPSAPQGGGTEALGSTQRYSTFGGLSLGDLAGAPPSASGPLPPAPDAPRSAPPSTPRYSTFAGLSLTNTPPQGTQSPPHGMPPPPAPFTADQTMRMGSQPTAPPPPQAPPQPVASGAKVPRLQDGFCSACGSPQAIGQDANKMPTGIPEFCWYCGVRFEE